MNAHNETNNGAGESGSRRSFLRKSLLGTALLAIVPRGLRSQTEECDPTSTDFFGEGPFYTAGAPTRQVLAGPEEAGQRLFLTGIVYANDCVTPVRDAVLDIWHADDTGCYSRFDNCENPSGDDYKLRGIIRTGATGAFALETVKPGFYLNGTQFRPSHIHLKARHPQIAELTTQLYFEGDPYIDIDPAASRPDAAGRIIPLTEREDGLHGIFDIVLDVQPTSDAPSSAETATGTWLRQNHPNPAKRSTRIPFHLEARAETQLTIHDMEGRLQIRLVEGPRPAGSHVVEWNLTDAQGKRVPSGTYVCRLQTAGTTRARVITIL